MIVGETDFKKYVLGLSEKGKRIDGRGLLDYRQPIKIEYGISKNAEGSAAVTIGKTRVICGIKMEVGEPYPDRPDEGTMIVSAEFAALASPEFEPGAPGEKSIELARIVDRGIRESGAIDVKKLCIKEGEKVWLVFIDIYVQNHDGNLIDAAALAAMAALLNAKFPKLNDDGTVNYKEHTDTPLPIVKKPIACTITKIGDKLFVDANADEENVSDARITITSDENGVINAIQKGGEEGMTVDEIEKCAEIAVEKAQELRKYLG
ncbi:MAG: exosome complex protein Rrp42 [Nanoarchaeota archaeon]|nr:exosome complex protein Rrp42 [Nanoarchaeota archaeon]